MKDNRTNLFCAYIAFVAACVLVLLILVSRSPAAPACTTTQCVTANPVVTVASPVVATAQVLVPVYGSQYLPSGSQQQQTASDEVLLQILQELREMRKELASLKQPAVLPLSLANASATLTKSCAKCHGQGTAEKDGGGFAMFDASGGLMQFGDADKRRIVARVSRNSMPPAPAKLSAADKKTILESFQGR